jgi:hypothetical protein
MKKCPALRSARLPIGRSTSTICLVKCDCEPIKYPSASFQNGCGDLEIGRNLGVVASIRRAVLVSVRFHFLYRKGMNCHIRLDVCEICPRSQTNRSERRRVASLVFEIDPLPCEWVIKLSSTASFNSEYDDGES